MLKFEFLSSNLTSQKNTVFALIWPWRWKTESEFGTLKLSLNGCRTGLKQHRQRVLDSVATTPIHPEQPGHALDDLWPSVKWNVMTIDVSSTLCATSSFLYCQQSFWRSTSYRLVLCSCAHEADQNLQDRFHCDWTCSSMLKHPWLSGIENR